MACLSGLLILAVLITFFAWHTDRSARAFDARGVPPNTLPGLAEPRFFIDNDSYAWLSFARDSRASGVWRLRYTFMDNAPYGREMHWSHPLIWSLRGLTSAIMACTKWPAARALESSGIWAMPIFQFIFLGMFFVVLMKKMGGIPAGLFCALALTLDGLNFGFHPLRPDHHGLQLGATLLSFACLQLGGMGWTRIGAKRQPTEARLAFRPCSTPVYSEARRWFIAAGAFGGLALWLGATVWLFTLAVIALSALAATPMFFRPLESEARYVSALWRWWAGSGILTGICAYLLEYAPSHFAMRLEVNHPLYWLCWLGVAEGLCFLGTASSIRFWKRRQPVEWFLFALALIAVIALPLLIRLGPVAWHQMNHPLLQRLHAKFIDEFQSGWPTLRSRPIFFFFSNMGILPLIALGWMGGRIRNGGQPTASEAPLRSAFAFSGLFFLLTLFQLRWGYFLAGGLLWFSIYMLSVLGKSVPKRGALVWTITSALLANTVVAAEMRLQAERTAAIADSIPAAWAHASITKRIALQWGLAANTNQWRMVGMAADAPALYYFAGIQSVASLYWENAAGWQAETDFFADDFSAANAATIARNRQLTCALVPASDGFADLYLALKHGHPPANAECEALARLLAFPKPQALPDWIHLDEPLTAIASRSYTIQTPRGLAGLSSPSRVYRLAPHD